MLRQARCLFSSSANRAGKASKPRPPTPAPPTSSSNHGDVDPLDPSSRALNISQSAKNVTFLLDNLLKDYDNSLRPDMGGTFVHSFYFVPSLENHTVRCIFVLQASLFWWR